MSALPNIANGIPWRQDDRSRRRISAWILALWTSFLLLNHFQPCCESLFESIPHQHASLNSDGAGAHTPAAHGGVDEHDHCAGMGDIDDLLSEFLASPSLEFDIKLLYAGLALLMLYSLSPSLRSRPVNNHERGPPGRVYLTTLRLRI